MKTKIRYIAHVDMDAFFAAVETRENPSLRGKPVIIGADPKGGKGRGVVSTCSYEAREYGIHSAMPISIAYRKCPQGCFLYPDMEKYSKASYEMFEILERFTPDIEPVSIDEAFLDITESHHLFGGPLETCKKIKRLIKKETGLIASVGLAPNKMVAKVASDLKKPDGLVVVESDRVLEFLHPLSVKKLWGVGVKTYEQLANINILTIGDLAKQRQEDIEAWFGMGGLHMWELANGIDERPVEIEEEAKSISNEHTFAKDTSDLQQIKNSIMRLSEKVSRRMRKEDMKARTITLKIRFKGFKTYTRALTLVHFTSFVDDIYGVVIKKLDEFDVVKNAVRLIGVKASNLCGASEKQDLFDEKSAADEKKERIHQALDKIINRFGDGAIRHRK